MTASVPPSTAWRTTGRLASKRWPWRALDQVREVGAAGFVADGLSRRPVVGELSEYVGQLRLLIIERAQGRAAILPVPVAPPTPDAHQRAREIRPG